MTKIITRMTIELEIEHDGSSSTQEITNGIQMILEQDNHDSELPDDFGVMKATVKQILVEEN